MRIGITAIKAERRQIQIFTDVLVSVASMYLKVPNRLSLHARTQRTMKPFYRAHSDILTSHCDTINGFFRKWVHWGSIWKDAYGLSPVSLPPFSLVCTDREPSTGYLLGLTFNNIRWKTIHTSWSLRNLVFFIASTLHLDEMFKSLKISAPLMVMKVYVSSIFDKKKSERRK